MKQVEFDDLSFWLKLAAIGGLFSFIVYVMSFAYGFLVGLTW